MARAKMASQNRMIRANAVKHVLVQKDTHRGIALAQHYGARHGDAVVLRLTGARL